MKKLFQLFLKKSSKESDFKNQCFTSLYDVTVHNWFQVNKEGDFASLIKDKREATALELPLLHEIYHDLMNQYIELFGFTKSSLAIFKKKKEIAVHQLDYLITNDKKVIAQMEIAKLQLTSLIEQEIDVNLYELKPQIEKLQGRHIDFKKESVVEWFNILKSINGKTDK